MDTGTKKDCFAYSYNAERDTERCETLNVMICKEGTCPFYKKDINDKNADPEAVRSVREVLKKMGRCVYTRTTSSGKVFSGGQK